LINPHRGFLIIWRDALPNGGLTLNNWASIFGGSSMEKEPCRKSFLLSLIQKKEMLT